MNPHRPATWQADTPACPRCYEPMPCVRCVAIDTPPSPSWLTIGAAAMGTAAIIYATWFGGLFNG